MFEQGQVAQRIVDCRFAFVAALVLGNHLAVRNGHDAVDVSLDQHLTVAVLG